MNRHNPFVNRQPLATGGKAPFMERVRKALGHGAGHMPSETPPAHDDSVRQVAADTAREGLVDRFIERARANTMHVQRIHGDAAGIAGALEQCLGTPPVMRCILNARDLEGPLNVAGFLDSRGITVVRWGSPHCREEAFSCDASITDCRCAIADSGSVVVWSDESFGRSSTLVVPVHVVLMPASRIMADMIDALELVHRAAGTDNPQGRLPSNIVIINGPSKTADIEMNLITGVHGPKIVHILVLENL